MVHLRAFPSMMHNRALLISPRNRVFETLSVPPFRAWENFEDADSKVDKYCQKDYFKTPRATDAQYLEYQEKRVEVRSCIQCILLRSLLERKLFASISPLDKYLSIFRARRSSIVPFFKGLYARTTKFSETILTCCRAVSRPSWTFRWRPCRWRRR